LPSISTVAYVLPPQVTKSLPVSASGQGISPPTLEEDEPPPLLTPDEDEPPLLLTPDEDEPPPLLTPDEDEPPPLLTPEEDEPPLSLDEGVPVPGLLSPPSSPEQERVMDMASTKPTVSAVFVSSVLILYLHFVNQC
jgi:hypothetical protein